MFNFSLILVVLSMALLTACGSNRGIAVLPNQASPGGRLLAAEGSTPNPKLFFSDLESGPNTGGQNNGGVFVTIWGVNFGATQGSSTVSVGSGNVLGYQLWSDKKIIFQLGSGATTGSIVVHTSTGASNGLPFTIRSGNIFFVSISGNDANSGSFSTPWRTIPHAKNSINAGDTIYIEDGVTQTTEDSFTAYVSMDANGGSNSGTAAAPKAMVAYPNATVTIGQAGGLSYGLRTPNIGVSIDYWVLSQLHIIARTQAIDAGGKGWRIIGLEMQCPGADDQVGCFEMSGASGIKFYGNEVHNAGINPTSSKYYHAVYFSTDSNHIDVGWNHIHDNYTCRAIQFHSSPLCSPSCGAADTTGFNQYDLHVHDNLIHGDNCNGINFATVDPSKGTVEAYNNIIYDVGLMDPLQLGAAFSCIYVAGITNNGAAGGGTVQAYNNTLANCGANNSSNAQGSRGAFADTGSNPNLFLNVTNNIVYQNPGEIYIDGSTALISGSNNLWFGLGNGPTSGFINNINADPQFVSRSANDFHLLPGSPAIDRGATVSLNHDFDGNPRPMGSGYDLGAYEFANGFVSPPPSPTPTPTPAPVPVPTPTPTPAPAPTTGLVGYWKFNEGQGSLAYDSSGFGDTGNIFGALWSQGQLGFALNFPASNSYVDLGSPAQLTNLQNFTWAAWVKVNGGSLNGVGPVIEKGSGSDVRKTLSFTDPTSSWQQATVSVWASASTSSASSVAVDNSYTVGVWARWVVTFSNSTDRTFHIYKNGVEVSYSQKSPAVGILADDSTYNLAVGATPDTQFFQFNGSIDDVRIYNRVLSPTEIKSLP